MFRRIFAFLLLAWAIGFAFFAMLLPQPAGKEMTDGIVVVTGAGGRIERGVAVLDAKWSGKMLVSGVDREVKPEELASEYDIPLSMMECCITLGYEAVDTRSNAAEAAAWVREEKLASVRLVTSDWHMRRAARDLSIALDGNVKVVRDAVSSEPRLGMLFLEYHKFLIGALGHWLNL